ncbi:unnamed protein product [Arabidopsis lyrata]|nr:unnamed protein product [Arabidopsis lyrata]
MDQSLKKVIEGEINIEWTIVSPRSKLEFLVQSFPLAASNQSMGESRLNHRNQVKGRFPQEAILKKETIPSEKYVVHEKKLKHVRRKTPMQSIQKAESRQSKDSILVTELSQQKELLQDKQSSREMAVIAENFGS